MMKKFRMLVMCLAVSVASLRAQDNKGITPVQAPAISRPAPLPGATTPSPASSAPSTQPQQGAVDPKAGKFRFKEETHDFGDVTEGPLAECDFEFRNVGKKPIIISEAHGSCGCTVPSWPTEPILPKHRATIHVTYNTAGRVGPISKDVIITSDAQQSTMRLHLTGNVKPKPAETPAPAVPPPPAK